MHMSFHAASLRGLSRSKLIVQFILMIALVGGSPYFYNWYRWGYGWSFERKYDPLTPEEEAEAQRKLEKFFKGNPSSVCR